MQAVVRRRIEEIEKRKREQTYPMTGAEVLDFEFVQVMVKGDHSMPFVNSRCLQSQIESCEDYFS